MNEIKTETIVVNGTKKVAFANANLTEHQTKMIQAQEQPHVATVKQQWTQIKEEIRDTRKIEKINPYISYFPDFYRKEIKNAFIVFIVWTIILFSTLASIATALYFILLDAGVIQTGKFIDDGNHLNPWISLLMLPILVLVIGLWVVYFNKYYCFRSEAKTINFKDEKTLSINIVKLYKRLKTGYINTNWMSLTSYVLFLLVILINFVVAYAMYPEYGFGKVFRGDVSDADWHIYITFIIIFWSSVGVLLGTLVMHAVLLVTNYIRTARIENFYNFIIVPQEELDNIKKQKNRRDLIIFLCSIALVGLIGYMIYKLVKRNKTAKVVVG